MKWTTLFQQPLLIFRRPFREMGLPLLLFLGSAFGLFYWNVSFLGQIRDGAFAVNRAGVELSERVLKHELEQRVLQLSYAALLDPMLLRSLEADWPDGVFSTGFFERHPIALGVFSDRSIVDRERAVTDLGKIDGLGSILDRSQAVGTVVSEAFQADGQYHQAVAMHNLGPSHRTRGHGLLIDMEWVESVLLPMVERRESLVTESEGEGPARFVLPSVEGLAVFPARGAGFESEDNILLQGVEVRIPEEVVSSRMEGLRRTLVLQAIASGLFLSVMVMMGVHLLRTRRALQLAERRSALVGSPAHALRTPLTIISLYAETLAGSRELNDADRECSTVIARESGRLLHQLEDGLNFARIAAGKQEYRMNPVELNEIVESCLSGYEPYLSDSGYTVATMLSEEALPFEGDGPAVVFALDNVLQNATKYGGESKYVGVATYRVGNEAVVEITDRGIGIPAEELGEIFKEFHRASTATAQRGWGLGLYIVKHVVDSHGGRIEVDSRVGWGTQIRIYFPIREGAGNPEQDGTRVSRGATVPASGDPLGSGLEDVWGVDNV